MQTEVNKNQQNKGNSELNSKHFRAIELRYEGFSLKEIAGEIGIEYSTVRSWFMANGKLGDKYSEYASQENSLRNEQIKRHLRFSVAKAAKTITKLLDSDVPSVQLRAAQTVLDRCSFQMEEIAGEDKEPTLLDIASAYRLLKRAGEIDDD